jgi:hypothetical protein
MIELDYRHDGAVALAVERERFVDLFDGADQREGLNAFLEKRAPRWQADLFSSTEQTTHSTHIAHAVHAQSEAH